MIEAIFLMKILAYSTGQNPNLSFITRPDPEDQLLVVAL